MKLTNLFVILQGNQAGSEVWETRDQRPIVSLAFHPFEQLLCIGCGSEVHVWNWSLREPFMEFATGRYVNRVRFVAFDPTGTMLVTGVAHSVEDVAEAVAIMNASRPGNREEEALDQRDDGSVQEPDILPLVVLDSSSEDDSDPYVEKKALGLSLRDGCAMRMRCEKMQKCEKKFVTVVRCEL